MIAPSPPGFRWGQRVVAATDLYNDGSFPDAHAAALLVPRGASGDVVQIGVHVETGTNVYMVEFGGRHVVGCREDEIAAPAAMAEDAAMSGNPS